MKGWTVVKVTSVSGTFDETWDSFGATVISEEEWKEDPTSAKYAVFKEPAGAGAGEDDYEEVDKVADFRMDWEEARGGEESHVEVMSFERFKTIIQKKVAQDKQKQKESGGAGGRQEQPPLGEVEYYYQSTQRLEGPHPASHLLAWFGSGHLRPDTPLCPAPVGGSTPTSGDLYPLDEWFEDAASFFKVPPVLTTKRVPLGDPHDGWQKFKEGHSEYYLNLETFERQWTPPESHPHHDEHTWVMLRDASGTAYYHNHKTGETVWEAPPDFVPPEAAGAEALATNRPPPHLPVAPASSAPAAVTSESPDLRFRRPSGRPFVARPPPGGPKGRSASIIRVRRASLLAQARSSQ